MNASPAQFDSVPGVRRIVISGVGLITPLGHGAWDTFTALLAGRTLADRLERLPQDVDVVTRVRALGSVAVARHVASDPAVELAERAAREALTEAGADPRGMPCWLGTSKGAVGMLPEPSDTVSSRQAQALAMGPCGYLSHELRRRLRLGSVEHHVAACASSLYALHAARQHLLAQVNSTTDQGALVVSSEAALLPAFIHSYRRLGVLAPEADYVSRPLDQRRHGFVLAEAGAAIVLRPVDRVLPGQVELVDTAIATEAYDLIRPSPSMRALARVAKRLSAHGPIDLLHPHAPGTMDHDPVELDVLQKSLFGPGSAASGVYAVKGALGHSLGAAGLVALILAALMGRTRQVPPMPWMGQPMAHPLLNASRSQLEEGTTHAVFAAGFGGHVAGALIRRAC